MTLLDVVIVVVVVAASVGRAAPLSPVDADISFRNGPSRNPIAQGAGGGLGTQLLASVRNARSGLQGPRLAPCHRRSWDQ